MIEYMIEEACILAGGKSSRMGEDKGLKLLHGKPMIRYVIEALIPRFPRIKISAGNPEYNMFGYEVVADVIPEKGPMGGIYTALKNLSGDDLFIISCDMPYISGSSFDGLLQQKNESATVAVCDGKIQPLFGIYGKNLIPLLEAKIEQNQLGMTAFLREINATFVDINNEAGFLNINTPDDFRHIENEFKNKSEK
ncbi:MAG: molybdenum cofactor guanylyltransferase [Candidatus Azobacteroides sp.]|nr:molybdenum cofactor guanylyltransferase [Candidatus Azobacteroides sp.]